MEKTVRTARSVEEILNSESFRLLNFQIAEEMDLLNNLEDHARHFARRIADSEKTTEIHTTTREERSRGARNGLVFDIEHYVIEFNSIQTRMSGARGTIGKLQKMKQLLLNDYDFGNGEDAMHRAVFDLPSVD